jgi:hypothetical protein
MKTKKEDKEMSKKNFPDVLYVARDEDGDTEWWNAGSPEELFGMMDQETELEAAVYELKRPVTLTKKVDVIITEK